MKRNSKNNLLLISLHRKSLLNNYQKSVGKVISIKKIKKYRLGKILDNQKNIGIWGILNTENNYKIWKEIKKSDIIIFLYNKKFFSKAIVIDIKENKEIPTQIWDESAFLKNRNLLIFLEKIQTIDLDYEASIPTIINPNMSNAYYFGIMKVDEEKKNLLVSTFGNIEKSIDFLANPEKKNFAISDYLTQKQLDEEIILTTNQEMNKQRKGQQKFRENVLLNFNHTCAVCNLKDEELLEAAHIIPVNNEKTAGKTKNGICLCKNCHKMFDNGFFSFADDYSVIVSKKKKISKKTQSLLKKKKMGKNKILPSKEYLAMHRAKFGIRY